MPKSVKNIQDIEVALNHYRIAMESFGNPFIFLPELQKAVTILQGNINHKGLTPENLIPLAQIYYTVYIWDRDENTYKSFVDGYSFLQCATALMQQWKMFWKNEKNNDNQAIRLIMMIDNALVKVKPELTSSPENNLYWTLTRQNFLHHALYKSIIKDG
ncbi:MAG: hypothetical protein GX602_06130 [Dehalococcoidales bacterium]|nr:hypothetical protein [Dehalococcoidales bacterium]